jgi:hypothetical protein
LLNRYVVRAGVSHAALGSASSGAEARPLDVRRRRQAAQIGQRRVDAHEVDGPVAHAVRLGYAGGDPDQRGAGGFFPQGELPPVLLLAEVPAVVAPEDDDRVVLVRAGVERVDQPADVHVAVRDRRQVALDGLLPPART